MFRHVGSITATSQSVPSADSLPSHSHPFHPSDKTHLPVSLILGHRDASALRCPRARASHGLPPRATSLSAPSMLQWPMHCPNLLSRRSASPGSQLLCPMGRFCNFPSRYLEL